MTDQPLKRSFCGKQKAEVMQLIAGPTGSICDECVQLCVRVLITEHPEWRDKLDFTAVKRDLEQRG